MVAGVLLPQVAFVHGYMALVSLCRAQQAAEGLNTEGLTTYLEVYALTKYQALERDKKECRLMGGRLKQDGMKKYKRWET